MNAAFKLMEQYNYTPQNIKHIESNEMYYKEVISLGNLLDGSNKDFELLRNILSHAYDLCSGDLNKAFILAQFVYDKNLLGNKKNKGIKYQQ